MTRLNEAIARHKFRNKLPSLEDADEVIAIAARMKPRRVTRLRRGSARMFNEESEQLALVLDCSAEWLAFAVNAPGWAR